MSEPTPHSNETGRYSFPFDAAEHVRASRIIIKHAMVARWKRYLLRTVLSLFAIAMAINVWADIQRDQFPAALVGLIAIALVPLAPTVNGMISARQWKKLNPAGQREVTFGLSDDGVWTASFVGRSELRWKAVKQVVETREFFLFFVTERIAYYLPKRAVPDIQLPLLRDLVATRVEDEHVHVDR